ncbi:MAG: hypothetical protein L0271_18385 [Gemmatimonadetes bacterium]|nr:hypothetical protein [Gemmatimonadota bacterium]
MRRAQARCLALSLFVIAAIPIAPADPASAQVGSPRLWFTGWLGGFADVGGFSEATTDSFYRFDGAYAFGAGLHLATGRGGPVVGVDAAFSQPSYQKFERSVGTPLGSGDAKSASVLASVQLHGGGLLGFYLSAGGGLFAWDLDDPDYEEGWDLDPALQLGAGLEYTVALRFRIFADYGQWWVYHQKDDTVAKNTAIHNLVRVGARVGL